jgi:hypothetical protein
MTPNGLKDASTDPAALERMFRGARSSANIGVATGPASGVWVLDVEAAGLPILDAWQRQHGPLPTTVSSITGGGGKHLWFGWHVVEVRNRTKIGGEPMDCRGDGGYVVVPPSNHKSGRRYRWEHSPDDTPIVEAPSWLLDLVVGSNGSMPAGTITPAASGSKFSEVKAGEDLATHPGVRGPDGNKPGERHDTALRLIGSAIGRGVTPVEVERQAIEWARRCSPPMPDDEVLRIVRDLARKQGGRAAARAAGIETEVEAITLPEPAPWPILDQDAYYGLAGEIIREIEPETEADPVAILLQLLIYFGNVVGRIAHYVVEGTAHYANLFTVLVGSTARGRKGTSEGWVRQILREVELDWTAHNITNGLVSGEGLIWHVRDPIYRTENVKDKGRVVGTEQVLADPGVDDKRLLVVEPEFAAVLRVCRRETNTLSPTLRSAWDNGILRTLAKNSPATATDAHISIIGHITHEELRRALAEIEGFNGFCNRFLWFVVRRSKLLPDGGRDLDLTRHAQRLALAAEQARSVGRMHRDSGAAALWRQVYGELADDHTGGLLGAVTSRAEAQVLRLSMIYALLDGSGLISEPQLRAALAVWRYCRASAAMIFGGMGADPVEEAVLAAIRQSPGLGRSEIYRALGNHVKATVLVSHLARLENAGRVRRQEVPGAGTKPIERWFPCEQCELPPATGVERGTDVRKFAEFAGCQERESTVAGD